VNSSTWTISGNKFFQTGTRTANAGTPFNIHRAINIITASGGGYTIALVYATANATGITTYDGILQTGL
jgi:hypothetical protein